MKIIVGLGKLIFLSCFISTCSFLTSEFKTDKSSASFDDGENIQAMDSDGYTTGIFDVNAATNQTLVAGSGTGVSGAKLTISPGSFSIDTSISLTEGTALTDSESMSELGISAASIQSASAAVMIKSSGNEDPARPMTLTLQRPPAAGLALISYDESNIAIIYRVENKRLGVNLSGLLRRDALRIVGENVSIEASFFGIYQAVYLAEPISVKVEVKTQAIVKSKAESSAAKPAISTTTSTTTSPPTTTVPTVPTTASPAAFQISSPKYYTKNHTPTVGWTASGGAAKYHLKIGTDSSCSTTVQSYDDLLGTSEVLSTLADGIYYVCISASNATGSTNASNSGYRFVLTQMLILGQPDANLNGSNYPDAAHGMNWPSDIFVNNGRILLSDGNNQRVLMWNQLPTTNQQVPDVVLGQPNRNSTSENAGGQASSSSMLLEGYGRVGTDGTRIVVLDTDNSRVLIWNNVPTSDGQPADVVLGQPDMTTSTANYGGLSSRTLKYPTGMFYRGQQLIVGDYFNRRVLIWNNLPTTDFAEADLVLGQADFISADTYSTSANSFEYVGYGSMFSDGAKLFVADRPNHRVLVWNSFPVSNHAPADVVIGQTEMTANAVDLSAGGMSDPKAIAVHAGKIYVVDSAYDRVLVWNQIPTSNGANANSVIGPLDFTTIGRSSQSGLGLLWPNGVAVDDNAVYIADSGNHRVLIIPHE